jgi:NhaP-type Na+/H+ or K+/H+ antiporter
MTEILIFALVLMLGVLLSSIAHRTILSLVVIFLAAGFVSARFSAVTLSTDDPNVIHLTEFALFAGLFSDGIRLSFHDVRTSSRLLARALFIAMPVTFAFVAILSHFVADLSWQSAMLLAAILAPTDPVLVSGLIERPRVPLRLRRLLNLESGLNDGLALPAVVILVSTMKMDHETASALLDVVLGVALGAGLAAGAAWIARRGTLYPTEKLEPLYAFGIALTVLALSHVWGVNEFLAGFTSGVVSTSIAPEVARAFDRFGELLAEIFKLAAIFVFGALISPDIIRGVDWGGWILVAFIVIAARPLGFVPAMIGAGLPRNELIAAAWFGPKGFASALYALLVLGSGVAAGRSIFPLVAAAITASMILHSSTDVIVAGWFEVEGKDTGDSATQTSPSAASPGHRQLPS